MRHTARFDTKREESVAWHAELDLCVARHFSAREARALAHDRIYTRDAELDARAHAAATTARQDLCTIC